MVDGQWHSDQKKRARGACKAWGAVYFAIVFDSNDPIQCLHPKSGVVRLVMFRILTFSLEVHGSSADLRHSTVGHISGQGDKVATLRKPEGLSDLSTKYKHPSWRRSGWTLWRSTLSGIYHGEYSRHASGYYGARWVLLIPSSLPPTN